MQRPGVKGSNARQRYSPTGAFLVGYWQSDGVMSATLTIEECVNATCPWSGKPVRADSLTRYRGAVVGFCNTGCRDKFDAASQMFDAAIDAKTGEQS